MLGLSRPTAVFGQSDATAYQLQDTVNEAIRDIVQAHDWRLLTVLAEAAGDGSTSAFPVAADFDRFPKGMQAWTTRLNHAMERVGSLNDWLELEIRDYDYLVGSWIFIDGSIHIRPAPATGETIKYYYQSNLAVADNSGSTKAAATADDDALRLPERLLKLALIYRWRADRGLPYAEQMANFNVALEQAIVADKPGEKITIGRRNRMRGVKTAYPFRIL